MTNSALFLDALIYAWGCVTLGAALGWGAGLILYHGVWKPIANAIALIRYRMRRL